MPSLEASLRNLEKARAAWSHPPRPWRSTEESRVIRRLVWQWFNSREPGKWSGRAVARWLGVTHTYIQKLVREFATDPSEIEQDARRHFLATFEQLRRAQERTGQEKVRGWLREPRRWKVAEFKIGDEVVRAVVPTKAEERRKATEAKSGVLQVGLLSGVQEVPLWARAMPYYSPDHPCDSLDAVQHAVQEKRRVPRVPIARRWRPGRSPCF